MILIFASGSGTNFEALTSAFPEKVTGLVCNEKGALVLEKACEKNIHCYLVPHKNYLTRKEHERAILKELKPLQNIKLIVLAGYMRILSPFFLSEIKKEKDSPLIVNLHPADLNQYKGAHAYQYVIERKFPRWAISIHEVTEELDSGPLLNYATFEVYPYENPLELQTRVRILEHNLLIETVRRILW